MKFKVTGSQIESMNGEYDVDWLGLVVNLTQDRVLKPAIEYIVKWMCDQAGPNGRLWIGDSSLELATQNVHYVMSALGFDGWPDCVIRELEKRNGER